MKKSVLFVALAATSITLATSCKTSKSTSSVPASGTNTTTASTCATVVTYENQLKPIINQYCSYSGCHDSGMKGMDLTSYGDLKKLADEGEINKHVLKIKNMPPDRKLNESELTLFKCWLEGGSK